MPNQYLDLLNDPHFQGVNILFVLSFENNRRDRTDRTVHIKYYISTAEVEDYNVLTEGQNLFN